MAEQPNGYYVLNDIFRYLVEDEELAQEEAAPQPVVEAPTAAPAAPAAPAVDDQVTELAAVNKVDEKLEEAKTNGDIAQPKEVPPQTNGTPAEEETQAPLPAVEAELVENEKPQTPEPSPAPEQQEAEKEPEAPSSFAPKSWATIASKPGAQPPVIPAIPAAAPKAAPAAAPAAAASQPAAPVATPAAEPAASQDTASNDGAGWQTAGSDHKKTQSRAGEEQTVLAYVKNVTDKVDASLLKQTLSRFGKLRYFDVSRPKVSFLLPSTLPTILMSF